MRFFYGKSLINPIRAEKNMIKKLYEYLPNGAAKYKDIAHENALFILQKQ